MIRRVILSLASIAAGLGAAGLALAEPQRAPAASVPAADYANQANWLCLPGRADACKVDLSATIVSAGGGLRREEFNAPRRELGIDCFYVYPTVSLDPTTLSDLNPGPEERRVVASQFARFSAVCRTFAPMYRQLTLSALRSGLAEGTVSPLPNLARADMGGPGGFYNDVLDAWRWYMANENKGRGVVLIGHSQGTAMLTRLIQDEIDGKPVQKQLVSALLIGGPVQVAQGSDVGGSFQSIPLCGPKVNIGCVVAYSAFRDNAPPPANALFGRAAGGLQTACVNPANLKTGAGQPKSYFDAARANDPRTGEQQGWVTPFEPIGTPFVRAPGFVTTSCATEGGATFLKVHVNANPRDKRTDTLSGDVMQGSNINAGWGLHLIDMNLSMGDMVDLVGRQGRNFKPAR